jgi:outer membrane protein TolC
MVSSRLLVVILLTAALLPCAFPLTAAGQASPEAADPAAAAPGVVPATLSLEEAVDIALRCNPQVAIAEQSVWSNRGLVTQAQGALMPRLDVDATRSTPVNLPPFTFQSRNSTFQTDLTISQPLYTGGGLQKAAAAARSILRGSEGSYVRSRQQVAYLVRQAYYAVLTNEEGVNVSQEVLSSAQEHLRVAKLRYEAGVAPQYDALAAEARVARVQQELISAQAGRDTAWATLSTVLGVSIPAETKLSTPRPVASSEASLPDLTEEAMGKRPDLKVAAAQVAAAKAQVSVARSARQPTLSAGASYTFRPKVTIPGDQFGAPGTELVVSQSTGYISLSATWGLFTGGLVFGQIRTAQANQRQAEHALNALKLQIGLDVKTAYFFLQSANGQVSAAQKEVAQAQEAHRIATLRYQEGVGTSVEILDAEANLEGAKTRLNQAVYGLNLAAAQVDLAVGRGFEAPVPPTPTVPWTDSPPAR